MVRLKNVCDASIQNGGLKCVWILMSAKAMFLYYKKNRCSLIYSEARVTEYK